MHRKSIGHGKPVHIRRLKLVVSLMLSLQVGRLRVHMSLVHVRLLYRRLDAHMTGYSQQTGQEV